MQSPHNIVLLELLFVQRILFYNLFPFFPQKEEERRRGGKKKGRGEGEERGRERKGRREESTVGIIKIHYIMYLVLGYIF